MKVALPLENGRLSSVFARAPVFAIVDVDDGGVRVSSTEANPYAGGARGIGSAVVSWLASMGVEAVVAPNVGPSAFEALQAAGIRFYQAPPGVPIEEAVKMALSGGGLRPQGTPDVMFYGPGVGPGWMRRGNPLRGRRGRGFGMGRRRRRFLNRWP